MLLIDDSGEKKAASRGLQLNNQRHDQGGRITPEPHSILYFLFIVSFSFYCIGRQKASKIKLSCS